MTADLPRLPDGAAVTVTLPPEGCGVTSGRVAFTMRNGRVCVVWRGVYSSGETWRVVQVYDREQVSAVSLET